MLRQSRAEARDPTSTRRAACTPVARVRRGDTFRMAGLGGMARFAPPDARRPRSVAATADTCGWGCARRGRCRRPRSARRRSAGRTSFFTGMPTRSPHARSTSPLPRRPRRRTANRNRAKFFRKSGQQRPGSHARNGGVGRHATGKMWPLGVATRHARVRAPLLTAADCQQ